MKTWATYRLTDGRVQAIHEAADVTDWPAPAGHAIGEVVSGWPNPAGTGSPVFNPASGAVTRADVRTEAEAWADIRTKRDAMLGACDWVTLRAVDQNAAIPSAWLTYRQALRDVTSQADPFAITWPTPPV